MGFLLLLLLFAAIGGAIGFLLWLPPRPVLFVVGLIWVAALAAHLLLPEGAGLPTGVGDARGWGAAGLFVVTLVLYRAGLRWLRSRAPRHDPPTATQPPAPEPPAFEAAELDRYARHIVLREIGGAGQKKLKAAKVLVIGAGGLGSPALLYLAAAGVGTIGVVDDDTVANSNLQRQIIHTNARIGAAKVASAAEAMTALNPHIAVRTHPVRLAPENADGLLADYDLILDGSDNFDTRYLANRTAVALRKPLISAAITQWEGQIGLYHPAEGGPCYVCTFPERPAPGLAPSCAEAGVIAPLPGIIGAMMALEAVKYLTGAGQVLRGDLLIHDALWGETRKIRTTRRPDCPVCGGAGRADPDN